MGDHTSAEPGTKGRKEEDPVFGDQDPHNVGMAIPGVGQWIAGMSGQARLIGERRGQVVQG